jgi:hypothetical protein
MTPARPAVLSEIALTTAVLVGGVMIPAFLGQSLLFVYAILRNALPWQ